jgi:hypothetical protein
VGERRPWRPRGATARQPPSPRGVRFVAALSSLRNVRLGWFSDGAAARGNANNAYQQVSINWARFRLRLHVHLFSQFGL